MAQLRDPPSNAVAVTPSDTVPLPFVTTFLYIGGTGNLTVSMAGSGKVLFTSIPVGLYPIRVSQVWATGTAAANIVAFGM